MIGRSLSYADLAKMEGVRHVGGVPAVTPMLLPFCRRLDACCDGHAKRLQ
jgi:hypothetical protein